MMQRLLPALLGVWIDHGADEDWGPVNAGTISWRAPVEKRGAWG
jgi:hypothetical protein